MLILSTADVRRALPMRQAIEGMKVAYASLSAGKVVAPLRSHIEVEDRGVALTMPAYLPDTADLAIKIVSVFPGNTLRGLSTIHAVVLVLDAGTGQPLAMMEGGTLTAIRTGAGSGAATDLLANHDTPVAAILGSGVQARTQLEAICAVRDVHHVRVFSPNHAHAAQFAAEMAGYGRIPNDIVVAKDAQMAVRGADIICAATSSTTPVLDGDWLKPGAHVNAVGSFTPQMQEIDPKTVERALIVVDSTLAIMEEAGDLLLPLEQGVIDEAQLALELGHIITGDRAGRLNTSQITLFKSVGVAVQDAVSAGIALANARKESLGIEVDF